MCTAMEVVVAENRNFSSRLYSDGSDECLSKPSGTEPCSIAVHQSRHILSTDDGIVEKRDEYAVNTSECFNVSAASQSTLTARSELSAISGEVVPVMSAVDSYTDADDIDNCIAVDSQSTSANDCGLSVNAVTAKLAVSDIGMANPSIELAEPQCTMRPKSLCSAKKSVCFPIDDTDSSGIQSATDDGKPVEKQESKRMSLLLRLFESKLFDMAIALPYLFNSKEPGVLAYLGQCFCLYCKSMQCHLSLINELIIVMKSQGGHFFESS